MKIYKLQEQSLDSVRDEIVQAFERYLSERSDERFEVTLRSFVDVSRCASDFSVKIDEATASEALAVVQKFAEQFVCIANKYECVAAGLVWRTFMRVYLVTAQGEFVCELGAYELRKR